MKGPTLAAPVTGFVVGRRRLAGTMMAGIFGSALALAVLGIHPTVIGAYLLLVASVLTALKIYPG